MLKIDKLNRVTPSAAREEITAVRNVLLMSELLAPRNPSKKKKKLKCKMLKKLREI